MSGRWNWPERFWEKVDRAGQCWLWQGTCNQLGYGMVWLDGKMRPAHRVSFEEVRGKIPDGLVLDHLCRVRGCVNPAHLEPVTQKENVHRGNGAPGLNSRKKKCPQGHAYKAIKTGPSAGQRYCPTCQQERTAAARSRSDESPVPAGDAPSPYGLTEINRLTGEV